jgi:hypothetical protein
LQSVHKSQAVFVAALSYLIVAAAASADLNDLLARVPPGANAVAVMDVKGLLASPMGVANKWREKLTHPDVAHPVLVPPEATHVVMASWIEPTTVEPVWEASVMELAKAPSMERIAKTQGGFVETVAEKQAAWSPGNAYFIRLDTRVLGALGPADRQFAARWARQPASAGPAVSPYLQSAADSISAKTQYLFAIDLSDVISAKRVRRRVSNGDFASLADKKLDLEKFSTALASIKGLVLRVSVGESAKGDCVVDFSRPAAPLAEVAKPLLLECLGEWGVGTDDFANWKFSVKDSALAFEGELSGDSLRQLFSIVDPPCPAQTGDADEQTAGAGPGSGKGPGAEDQKAIIAASKSYFDAVTAIIDNIGKQIRHSTSMTQGAVYIGRSARRIGRLPVLNVDPALVEWGTGVSARIGDLAAGLGATGFQARARAGGIQDIYTGGGTGGGSVTMGGGYSETEHNYNEDVARQNVTRQRLSVAAEIKAKAAQAAVQTLNEIEASRSNIRTAMTQKYKAAF